MPIGLDCPGCAVRLTLPDQLAGKQIRCKHCGWKIRVPGGRGGSSVAGLLDDFGREQVARRRGRRDEGDEYEEYDEYDEGRRARRSSALPWLIGGGAAAVVLIGVGVFFAFRGGDDEKPEVAQKPAEADPARPRRPAPVFPNVQPPQRPPVGNRPPVLNLPADPPDMPQARPPVIPGNPQVPPAPKVEETEEDRAAAVAWTVQPDPPAEKLELPPARAVAMPDPSNSGQAVFPTTPSRFVAVGRGSSPRDRTYLWDLKSDMKKAVGVIPGETGLREPMALAPGGKYLAGQSREGGATVDVFSFENGQGVRRVQAGERGSVTWVDFGASSNDLLVALDGFQEKTLQVWAIDSGNNVRNFTLPKDLRKETFALSPGRKYLAVTSRDYVYVYRLADGTLAGTQRVPRPEKQHSRYECKGLAFSPDGKELAGLFAEGLSNDQMIAAWDLARGEQTHAHVFPAEGGIRWYKGPAIDYLPDGQAWLVSGKLVVEHDTGTLLTKLNVGERDPNRCAVLPNDLLLVVTSAGVHGSPFVREAYERSVKAAREAGPGAQAAPKAADRFGVRVVRSAPGAAWSVRPEVLTPLSLGSPVPLANPGKEVLSVHFSRADTGHAATLSTVELAVPFIRKILRCDRYDLTGRRHLGGFEVPAKFKEIKPGWTPVADLSPKGERFAVCSPTEPQRVDLFAAEGGAHLAGFLPYRQEVTAVKWLAFLDADRLLTLSETGRLTLWEVPACKAVYESGDNLTKVALDPPRKWLAAVNGTSVDLIDAATGEAHGRLPVTAPLPADGKGMKLAFRPDGQELAAVIPGGADQTVLLWNLQTGQLGAEFKTEAVHPEGLHYCGTGHLLAGDGALIDLERKLLVWSYSHPHGLPRANDSPDARHWFVAQGPNNAATGLLTAAALPDPAVGRMLEQASEPGVEKVLGPGDAIAIKLNFPGPPGDAEGFRKDLYRRLSDALTGRGFRVDDRARVALVITANQTDSGDRAEVTEFGAPGGGLPRFGPRGPRPPFGPRGPGMGAPGAGGGGRTINLPQVNVTAALVAADGQT
ncbi:MAG TPA: hypothetical protein VIL46_09240, partial [Gemmataceae bacterium]